MLIGALIVGFAGCGGGGGGSNTSSSGTGSASNSASAEQLAVTFIPARLEATSLERDMQPVFVDMGATIDFTGTAGLYLFIDSPGQAVSDATGFVTGNSLVAKLTMTPGLAPGSYDQQVLLHVSKDSNGSTEMPGSPFSVPLHYLVKPNLHVATPATMTRTGQEVPSAQVLAATLPPEAGRVSIRGSAGMTQAFDVALDTSLSQVVVTPRAMRAGTYTASYTLSSDYDSRYQTSFDVQYVVQAPVTGEQAMTVTPSSITASMKQGDVATYRFKVQRASWDATLESPVLSGSSIVGQLRNLGNDEYEVTVDTRPLVFSPNSNGNQEHAYLVFKGGPYVDSVAVPITVEVGLPFSLTAPRLEFNLVTRSTAADLKSSTSIEMADGSSVTWHASSNQAWLKLARISGITGVDALPLEVDRATVTSGNEFRGADLTVWVDKPGTQPYTRSVTYSSHIPKFTIASPGVLLGSTARIYVAGPFYASSSDILVPGVVQVDGATLRGVQWICDCRFVGDVGALMIDLDGITPGQAVTVRTTSPLAPSSLTLLSQPPWQMPSGFANLPLGNYRPPTINPATGDVYFTGNEQLAHWSPAGGNWSAPQWASFPGMVDATLTPDAARLYGVRGRQVFAIDPPTLREISSASLSPTWDGGSSQFDPTAPTTGHVLAYSADGRALASFTQRSQYSGWYGVKWLCGRNSMASDADIMVSPDLCDPGAGDGVGNLPPDAAPNIVRSAQGQSLGLWYPGGGVKIYQRFDQARLQPGSIPAGASLTAISDDGNWVIQDNGDMRARHVSWSIATNLATRIPAGYTAGGYGVSGSGSYALVYGYQIVQEANGPRARNPKLWLLDLYQAPTNPNSFAVLAEVALPEAVGCNTSLAAAETCQHSANITMTPGDRNAIVLGPRGISSVPMPANLDVILSANRAKALKASTNLRKLSPIPRRP
jgi:hypothetical protein